MQKMPPLLKPDTSECIDQKMTHRPLIRPMFQVLASSTSNVNCVRTVRRVEESIVMISLVIWDYWARHVWKITKWSLLYMNKKSWRENQNALLHWVFYSTFLYGELLDIPLQLSLNNNCASWHFRYSIKIVLPAWHVHPSNYLKSWKQ